MRLVDHMVLVKADDSEDHGILINTLSGKIHILSSHEASCVQKWKKDESLLCENEREAIFAKELECNGYIMSAAEEEKLVERMIIRCREQRKTVMRQNKCAVFVLTYMCNFACPYCYESAPKCTNSSIMTKDMVDKIFEINSGTLSQIALYGGEPFLPETKSIIEYIISKAPNAEYSATTNGYYLLEFLELLQKINIQHIMVTLDGAEHIHNKTRKLKSGKGTYSKIIQGIRACLMFSIPIKIRMNISPQNIEACEQLREVLINEFHSQFDAGILTFELQPIFQISAEKRDDLYQRLLFDKTTGHGLPAKYNMISLTASPILRSFISDTKRRFRHKYCNCDAGDRRLFYDAEGNIYSCILSLNNKIATIGTYYPEYKLKEKSIFTRNIESIPQCRMCKMKFICGGGCAYAILNSDGDVMKPNCQQIIHEIYHDLPKLFRKYTDD